VTRSDELAARRCQPCRAGTPPLAGAALAELAAALGGGWRVVDAHHLEKEFRFANFRDALAFTNRVGALADEQDHHPDVHLSWGRVRIEVWTHTIDGLAEGDFVLAARIDRLPVG
jgi:4a-hydroxytetrahydrobiopterin dehydratase